MTMNTAPAPHALTELTDEEQETVAGGLSQRYDCDTWGNAAQMLAGVGGAALARLPHPAAVGVGLALGGFSAQIGNVAKEICFVAGSSGRSAGAPSVAAPSASAPSAGGLGSVGNAHGAGSPYDIYAY